jgi:hypothetical protein
LFHFIGESIPFETRPPIEIRLFPIPINSLHFQEFFKNVQNSKLFIEKHYRRNCLSRSSETDVFNNLVTKLKQNGEKHKSFLRAQHGDVERSGKGSCGIQSPEGQELCAAAAAAYVSIRQHASAYGSMRQHTSAYVSIRQHTSAYVSIRQHTSASWEVSAAAAAAPLITLKRSETQNVDLALQTRSGEIISWLLETCWPSFCTTLPWTGPDLWKKQPNMLHGIHYNSLIYFIIIASYGNSLICYMAFIIITEEKE